MAARAAARAAAAEARPAPVAPPVLARPSVQPLITDRNMRRMQREQGWFGATKPAKRARGATKDGATKEAEAPAAAQAAAPTEGGVNGAPTGGGLNGASTEGGRNGAPTEGGLNGAPTEGGLNGAQAGQMSEEQRPLGKELGQELGRELGEELGEGAGQAVSPMQVALSLQGRPYFTGSAYSTRAHSGSTPLPGGAIAGGAITGGAHPKVEGMEPECALVERQHANGHSVTPPPAVAPPKLVAPPELVVEAEAAVSNGAPTGAVGATYAANGVSSGGECGARVSGGGGAEESAVS